LDGITNVSNIITDSFKNKAVDYKV